MNANELIIAMPNLDFFEKYIFPRLDLEVSSAIACPAFESFGHESVWIVRLARNEKVYLRHL